MTSPRLFALGVAATALLAAAPASARHRHHRPVHPYEPTVADSPGFYPAGGWEAEAIARATARMQAAPGVTNELAPDAKETATGGPVGGVPGFSGGR